MNSAIPERRRCVGYYQFGHLVLGNMVRPHWLHRICSKVLLGWEWHDGHKVKNIGYMTIIGAGLEME